MLLMSWALLGALPLALANVGEAAAQQERPARSVQEAAALRAKQKGLNPQQAQCFTALFVTRASQMPNGRWKVLQDRRFGGVTFADEVSRTCAIAPRG
jgi:hypothetical protein